MKLILIPIIKNLSINISLNTIILKVVDNMSFKKNSLIKFTSILLEYFYIMGQCN